MLKQYHFCILALVHFLSVNRECLGADYPALHVNRTVLSEMEQGNFETVAKGNLSVTELAALLWEVDTSHHGKFDDEMRRRLSLELGRRPDVSTFYLTAIDHSIASPDTPSFRYDLAVRQLGQIGTAETIHLLGQLLQDDRPRNPELPQTNDLAEIERALRTQRPKISDLAAASLYRWMVETGRANPTDLGLKYVGLDQAKEIPAARAWWASPAAGEFRNWKPTASLVPKQVVPNPAQSPPGTPTDGLPSAWILAVIAAGLSAALLLALRSHRPGSR